MNEANVTRRVSQDRCLNCGKPFEEPSHKRKTCSDACRKQYERKGKSLNQSYSIIMRELSIVTRLAKSHPHLKPQIVETLQIIKSEVSRISQLAGDRDSLFLAEMKEGIARTRSVTTSLSQKGKTE